MMWRCIDRREPQRDYENDWHMFIEYQAGATGSSYGHGGEWMIGFHPGGDGTGCGFDHGMLRGDGVKWGDR